ncbi:MAG: YlmC/YmxH family sporulation protein [Firmicutes bacterium]|nr:YlmC/YmxH family sporulation protein [Bacillota bacterium]
MIRISEFESKQIINTVDGRIMGNICDFDIDPIEGKIISILLPINNSGKWFRRRDLRPIPWQDIKKIGVDVILAESKEQNIPDPLLDLRL